MKKTEPSSKKYMCEYSETCDSDDVIKTIILNANTTTGSQNEYDDKKW